MDWQDWINRNAVWLVCCLLSGLIGGYIGTQISRTSELPLSNESGLIQLDEADDTSSKIIKVYVCGEVQKSKVVELSTGARWEDAIQAAGGFTSLADTNQINLAKLVKNGDKVFVPTKIELSEPTGISSGTKSLLSNLIPINSAGKEDLMTLPGIGDVKAEAIILYREQNGRFDELEDLMKVSGIGEKTFEKLKDLIRLD